jgi:hypothetical protein
VAKDTDRGKNRRIRIKTCPSAHTDGPTSNLTVTTAVRSQGINLLSPWHGPSVCAYVLSFIKLSVMYLNKIHLILHELMRSNYAKLLSGSIAQVSLIIT